MCGTTPWKTESVSVRSRRKGMITAACQRGLPHGLAGQERTPDSTHPSRQRGACGSRYAESRSPPVKAAILLIQRRWLPGLLGGLFRESPPGRPCHSHRKVPTSSICPGREWRSVSISRGRPSPGLVGRAAPVLDFVAWPFSWRGAESPPLSPGKALLAGIREDAILRTTPEELHLRRGSWGRVGSQVLRLYGSRT